MIMGSLPDDADIMDGVDTMEKSTVWINEWTMFKKKTPGLRPGLTLYNSGINLLTIKPLSLLIGYFIMIIFLVLVYLPACILKK